MKYLVLVLALCLLSFPALADPAPLDPVNQAVIDKYTALRDATDIQRDDQAALKDALGAALTRSVGLEAQLKAAQQKQAEIDSYWKSWCGDRPGCATPAQ